LENYVDILVRRAEMVKNWREYVSSLAEAVRAIIPGSRVYVFGSVVEGRSTGGSDVDVLIVSDRIPRGNLERARLKVRIEELSSLPPYHPFELHLADREEGEWYFKRVGELLEI